MKTKRRSSEVSRPPRLAGLMKPSRAKVRVTAAMAKSWAPEPGQTQYDKRRGEGKVSGGAFVRKGFRGRWGICGVS